LYLAVGTERAGVKLLWTNPPWSAKVAHKGGEYEVTLFQKTYEQYFTAAGPKLRNIVPGLIIQGPPALGGDAAKSPTADPATGAIDADAAIEAQRLRATPVDQTDDADPNADSKNEQTDDESDDEEDVDEEDVEETGDETGVEEPHDDDEEPQPEEEPEGSADAVVNDNAALAGESGQNGNGPSVALPDPPSPTVPK
jgi:hypothetical protein